MEYVSNLPIWGLALCIFFLRIGDVSLGTLRTLAIVEGRTKLSMLLGFFEVLIWITVVAQVISRVHESIVVAVAFAGGFAAGNAVGILLEKKLAMGTAVLRIISTQDGENIAKAMRNAGQVVTTFYGNGRDGRVTMVYAACPRRRVRRLVALARALDPRLVHTVERAGSWCYPRNVVAHPTGWRAFWKKK